MTFKRRTVALGGLGVFALAVSSLGTPALSGCVSQACNEVGCQDGVEITFVDPTQTSAFAWLELCLNEECVNVPWTVPQSYQCTDTGDDQLMVTICSNPGQGIGVSLTPSSEILLNDGDELHLLALDLDANIRFEETVSLSYEDHYPNGKDCAPICRMATAEF
jgi:hypothetical protein